MGRNHNVTPEHISRRSFVGGSAALAVSLAPLARSAAPREMLALVENRREELVALLSQMIKVRSQSGESAAEAQGIVKNYLADLPYQIEESADRPSQYTEHAEFMSPNPRGDGPFINIVGWPEGSAKAQYGLFSHIDTHLTEEGWDTDPYEPTIEGKRLYGLGAADDKGGVAAMLIAASILSELGAALPVVMSLHGKGGGSRGSLPVFERLRHGPQKLGACLYVHPAETGRGLDDVKTEVQGVLDLELSVKGWRAPAMEIGSVDSAPWDQGGNAVEMSWKALSHLRATAFDGVPLNLGVMQGGDRIGSVADSAGIRFRLKFAGNHTWRSLLQMGEKGLADFLARLAKNDASYSIDLNAVGYRTNPGRADWEAPVSRVLRNSITEILGKEPAAYPNHYAGDIRYPIRLLGVPAYGIGSLAGNFYGPNEWVDIDDLMRLVAVIVQTVTGWSEL